MFDHKTEYEIQNLDSSTAYYMGMIQGAGIGVIGTMILGGIALLCVTFM